MAEAVRPQDLVVGEVERARHAVHTSLPRVRRVVGSAAGLATREVRHEGPPLATPLLPPAAGGCVEVTAPRLPVAPGLLLGVPPPEHGVPPLHLGVRRRYVLQAPHDGLPVPVQVVPALQVHLITPAALLLGQEVDESGLVVGEGCELAADLRVEDPAPLAMVWGLGTHAGPGVEKVEAPLGVSEEEDAGVEAHPVAGGVHHVRPTGNHEVVRPVAVDRGAELHVGEGRVLVHPPHPFRLRVSHHGGANQRDLGPAPGHLWVEEGGVVEQIVAVEAAVVGLVLIETEEKVVTSRVGAPPRR